MKKLHLISIMLVVSALPSIAQISKTPTIEKSEAASSLPTGEKNFLGPSADGYIGRILYLRNLPAQTKNGGYAGFILDYKEPISAENTYKYMESDFYRNKSRPDLIADRYYNVEDVLPSKNEQNIFFLKLRELSTSDIVYYKYNAKDMLAFPFISVDYAETAKKMYVGESFVLRGRNWLDYSEDVFDMDSGKTVDYSPGTVWTCTNVTITGRHHELALILTDKANDKIFYPIDIVDDTYFIFKDKDAEKYKAKFGTDAWKEIVAKRISKGFSKEMVSTALGTPKTVSETAIGEQWVYDNNQSVYFVDGVVQSFKL